MVYANTDGSSADKEAASLVFGINGKLDTTDFARATSAELKAVIARTRDKENTDSNLYLAAINSVGALVPLVLGSLL